MRYAESHAGRPVVGVGALSCLMGALLSLQGRLHRDVPLVEWRDVPLSLAVRCPAPNGAGHRAAKGAPFCRGRGRGPGGHPLDPRLQF